MVVNAPSNREIAERMKYVLKMGRTRAQLGDLNGTVIADRPGHVYVSRYTETGTIETRQVRMRTTMPLDPGRGVLIGLDFEREQAVVEPDFVVQVAQGIDPRTNNPADRNIFGFINQERIQTFLVHAISDASNDSLSVGIRPFFYLFDGTWKLYTSPSTYDLTSLVPSSSNEHRLVGVFLDASTNTIAAYGSTAQNQLEELDTTDVQEIQDQASSTSVPNRFFRLYTGQTTIREQDSWRDGRQFINVPSASSSDDTDYYDLTISGTETIDAGKGAVRSKVKITGKLIVNGRLTLV